MLRRAFTAQCLASVVIGDVGVAVAGTALLPPLKPPTEAEMGAWWVDLEKGDAEGSRALLKFATWPKESVAFIAARLKPLSIDAGRVRVLITDLNSDRDDVWKTAFEELDYFDARLAIDLEALMGEVTDVPARTRLVAVLCGRPPESMDGKQVQLRPGGAGGERYFNFFDGRGSWWAEYRVDRLGGSAGTAKKKWTRASRAIAVLEHVGTAEAAAVLRRLAGGHPDAHPTKEAKAAADRVEARNR